MIPDTSGLLYRLCKTTYAKKTVNSIFIVVLACLFRLMLYTLLSFIFIFDNVYVDFFVQCALSIYLCTKHDDIKLTIEYFEPQLYNVTKYIINNYSAEEFDKWKNITVLSSLMLCYSYFLLVEVNSSLIRFYLLEYIVCYAYLDMYENPKSTIRNFILNKLNNAVDSQEFEKIDKIPSDDFLFVDLPVNKKNKKIKYKNHKIDSDYDIID
jgi:hypothetical protein